MDAKRIAWFWALVATTFSVASGQAPGRAFVVQSENFRVFAPDARLANEVASNAEAQRNGLALHWLGYELPRWSEPCPIRVYAGPTKLASGETKYTLAGGEVHRFEMVVSGTSERILDSVLPHEITHTVLATHFAPTGKPVPRWADEGACTTVEHPSEKGKHDAMLIQFLGQGRGIPFKTLFSLRDYPKDLMPLYAQGYSVTSFLIAQRGPKEFVRFLELGMQTNNWDAALAEVYDYPMMGKLQTAWNRWVADGGGPVEKYTAIAQGVALNALAASDRNLDSDINRNSPVDDDGVRLAGLDSRATPASSSLSAVVDASANDLQNNSVNASGPGYYASLLRRTQQHVPNDRLNNNRLNDNRLNNDRPVPYSVSQPAPFQSFGGTLYR